MLILTHPPSKADDRTTAEISGATLFFI